MLQYLAFMWARLRAGLYVSLCSQMMMWSGSKRIALLHRSFQFVDADVIGRDWRHSKFLRKEPSHSNITDSRRHSLFCEAPRHNTAIIHFYTSSCTRRCILGASMPSTA